MKLNILVLQLVMSLIAMLFMSAVFAPTAQAADDSGEKPVRLFTVITSGSAETQFMALILSMQSSRQGAEVRILLCDEAGELALRDKTFEALMPLGRSPQELLEGLIENGVTVDVCAIFLPNREDQEEDLIPGVGVARPDEVATYMLKEGVRYFTF